MGIKTGTSVSHYHVLEKLGESGMGVVYKAEDTKLKRTVALKFLPPELTRNADAKTRFIREAQAASALQHHNICTIHDIDETPDDLLFIVMDYYRGETLKQKIIRGPLSVTNVLDISIQIAEGLGRTHEEGIVHRDILSVQKEVAKAIAQQIKANLTEAEKNVLNEELSINPAAHEAYLKGHYFLNQISVEGARKAIEYIVNGLINRSPTHYISPTWIAIIYTSLGDTDEAFEWLEKAYPWNARWLLTYLFSFFFCLLSFSLVPIPPDVAQLFSYHADN
jgi:tRNA A-37 threonylcarbamoyl transferase component Bud32